MQVPGGPEQAPPGGPAPGGPPPGSSVFGEDSPFGGGGAAPTQNVNPFESPKSQSFQDTKDSPFVGGAAGADAPIVPTPFDGGDVTQRAFELWKQHLGILVGITLVPIGIGMGFGVIQNLLMQAGEEEMIYVAQGLNIINNIVGIFIGIGVNRVYLKLARGQHAEFGEIFSGGKWFLPILGFSILAGIAVVMGFLLLIIPGIILCVLFWPAYFLIIDDKAGVMESFGKAYEIGKVNAGASILCWLISLGIGLLGILACCVGLIFAQPLIGMIWAVAYLRGAGQIR